MTKLVKSLEHYQAKLRKVINKAQPDSKDKKEPGLITDNSRKGFIKCSKLVKEALESLQAHNKENDSHQAHFLLQSDLSDQLLADIQSYDDCPTNNNLLEIALWRRIRRITEVLPNVTETHKKQLSMEETDASFCDYFKVAYTDGFSKELERIREDEEGEFDHRKVAMLIDNMETGVNYYDQLEKKLAANLEGCCLRRHRLSNRGGKKRKLPGHEEDNNSDNDSSSNNSSSNNSSSISNGIKVVMAVVRKTHQKKHHKKHQRKQTQKPHPLRPQKLKKRNTKKIQMSKQVQKKRARKQK